MRTNQNKRMRGRNRKSQNPLSRVFESNGPDVKIRGSASHIAEKYIQLARDAQSSGDPIAAENYYQHAEHYFRLIAAAQEQYRQSQPFYQQQGEGRGDDAYDDVDDDGAPVIGEPNYGPREPHSFQAREGQPYQQSREGQSYSRAAPYSPREPQPYPPREAQPHHSTPQPQAEPANGSEQLPSFITGNGGQPQYQGNGQNGHEAGPQGERYPMHRRRRRHRGPRNEVGPQSGAEDTAPRPANE